MNKPQITMMEYKPPYLEGLVVINGTEYAVVAFNIEDGASASVKRNKLIERAVAISGDDLIALTFGEL